MSPRHEDGESERKTRKLRIDPRLDSTGWKLPRIPTGQGSAPFRTEEEETANGPADYALWLDGNLVGVVEAKKVSLGPQNVLTQAARYAKGLKGSAFNFDGHRCPFLYSTNGEVLWFHDVRHTLNRSRQVAAFHTPDALSELLGRDFEASLTRLANLENDNPRLRPYQRAANEGVEKAIVGRKRSLLIAMATGTGKTFTLVNQIHRLMRAGVAKRVLFLVDRRALAAQAVRAFASFETAPGRKFDREYEVYSSRFQRDDFGEEDKFDPKLMPQRYLTEPSSDHSFVYVCTIQRMAINLFGRGAVFTDEDVDDDAEQLDIPIHAFDLIVADECHRGYTAQQESAWRNTLDHFDAIKIGLTATPAAHTTGYFKHKAFEYSYTDAVRDGYLVDYDAVNIRSDVRMKGVFLREGERVEVLDPVTGLKKLDEIEDERQFDTSEIEQRITAPDSNRKIVDEVRKYALEHEELHGRFPKTLFFAANDLPNRSHADQLVDICRDAFGRGDSFVSKITGRVDRPLQRIREFRNRPVPGITVTVDMLTTGVDIPDLEYLVFMRPVKSRILFEQMVGRGTRKGEKFPDKDHFTVFDCFDGTLLEYFKGATGVTAEMPAPPTRAIAEIIELIWSNHDRAYNIGVLVKRLQRIDKSMAADARTMFAAYIPDGNLAAYARGLPYALNRDFVESMKLLREGGFQNLLETYPRPAPTFIIAHETIDTVSSEWLVRDGQGNEHKPEDYLAAFSKFVKENPAHIYAIGILLNKPKAWNGAALVELRQKLAASAMRFTEGNLRKAYEIAYRRALVDIISMVKHAADASAPLLTASERVERAFATVTARRKFTAEQQQWLDRIRDHLRENLSIERDDFDDIPVFSRHGGLAVVRRLFPKIDDLIHELNEAVAA